MIHPPHRLLSALAMATLFIAASHATELSNAGAQVTVSHAPPSSQCKYISGVSGSAGMEHATARDETALRTSATNDLRNNAAGLGMNYVELLQYQVDNGVSVNFLLTDNWLGNERLFDNNMPQVDVTISGNGYHCP